NLLTENGLLALVIVMVILGLFLEYRLAFWVMVGMSISFIGAMIFLPVVDISINMISMFGFMIVLGIVVDDAIVVGETIYESDLNLLTENGLLALVIVMVILGLFLEYRLAFWVMVGMSISFIGAMIFLPVVDISINMISMFGFMIVLGIVVDDAIVVGENIYEYRQKGYNYLDAAIFGARNVSKPVIFSVLTTIIAFVPLLFIPGETGKYWWPLPVVVIVMLAISLFEAL